MRIAIAVAAAIAATSVSFAVATAANRQPTAQSSATDRVVVNQLKTTNRTLRDIKAAIGPPALIGPDGLRREMRSLFDDTEEAIGRLCHATSEQTHRC